MTTGNIEKAVTTIDFERARELFEEYAGTLNFDLEYQDFRKELENICKQYAPPTGALLLYLTDDEKAAGCAGIRSFSEGIAELKRLYVRPAYRGLKIGKLLLESATATAGELGYRTIRLDTVPGQETAHDLYRNLGFYEITAYRYSPIPGTLYFEKLL